MAGVLTPKGLLKPAAVVAVALALLSVTTVSGRDARHRAFGALRIPRPASVNVNLPAFAGAAGNRQLPDMVSGMIAAKVKVTADEADQAASGVGAAARLAGFSPHLAHGPNGAPTFTVTGARILAMVVSRDQLRTMFAEAGRSPGELPSSLDGATAMITTPRAIRAQYGHCPETATNTIAGQINGPPAPTADNADCVILSESPVTSATLPAEINVEPVIQVVLELSGMSPTQAQTFQKTFDWKAILALQMPRGIRTFEAVDVNGARGMLISTVSRRGPTYDLVWIAHDMVFSLAGYGSPATALPLARSID